MENKKIQNKEHFMKVIGLLKMLEEDHKDVYLENNGGHTNIMELYDAEAYDIDSYEMWRMAWMWQVLNMIDKELAEYFYQRLEYIGIDK